MISWNINTACNYRCSYCTQRFKEDRGRWSRDTPRFLEAFARLPGPWEIKLSGGEPFVHPTLDEIVGGLAQQGRSVSVVTNFSASEARWERFLQFTGPRLRVVSCSLHLEYADPDAFLARAVWLQRQLPEGASLNVTCVATRDNLPRLAELGKRFSNEGVRFKVQPEKQNRDVVPYTDAEQAAIRALGGHNGLGEIAFNFQGSLCWSGSRYFILDDKGEAFRCYPARRYKVERMGNFLDPGFTLGDAPTPCLYACCNCTVPIERNMVSAPQRMNPS